MKFPQWYIDALERLNTIQEHIADYEDDESLAPTAEVFASVRAFLRLLVGMVGEASHKANFFVSHNGHILLSMGDVDVRFRPEISFCQLVDETHSCISDRFSLKVKDITFGTAGK